MLAARLPALVVLSVSASLAFAPAARAADPTEPLAIDASVAHDPAVAASWMVDADSTPAPAPAPAPASAPAPAPSLPALADAPASESPALTAERARMVGRGRSLVTAGTIFSGVAVIGLVTTTVFTVQGRTGPALGTAGLSLVFATTGLALVVPGRKRMRNPERYMKTPRVAVAPMLSPQIQGGAVTVRF